MCLSCKSNKAMSPSNIPLDICNSCESFTFISIGQSMEITVSHLSLIRSVTKSVDNTIIVDTDFIIFFWLLSAQISVKNTFKGINHFHI